jgi:hypothetical protein
LDTVRRLVKVTSWRLKRAVRKTKELVSLYPSGTSVWIDRLALVCSETRKRAESSRVIRRIDWMHRLKPKYHLLSYLLLLSAAVCFVRSFTVHLLCDRYPMSPVGEVPYLPDAEAVRPRSEPNVEPSKRHEEDRDGNVPDQEYL